MASTHVRTSKIAKYVDRLKRRREAYTRTAKEHLDRGDHAAFSLHIAKADTLGEIVYDMLDEFELIGEDEQ
ncbi:hypothetical protein PMI08_03140 [Brevibacillus sp. CF112]|nr:hypothetical protein PMI08_03140 [Brevibacillus sp. CF112]